MTVLCYIASLGLSLFIAKWLGILTPASAFGMAVGTAVFFMLTKRSAN